jgi:hypothetical protein
MGGTAKRGGLRDDRQTLRIHQLQPEGQCLPDHQTREDGEGAPPPLAPDIEENDGRQGQETHLQDARIPGLGGIDGEKIAQADQTKPKAQDQHDEAGDFHRKKGA